MLYRNGEIIKHKFCLFNRERGHVSSPTASLIPLVLYVPAVSELASSFSLMFPIHAQSLPSRNVFDLVLLQDLLICLRGTCTRASR
jgi:hypothetical protein